MVRTCWVNFQFRGVPLIWIKAGQGPIALAVGAGGGCLDIFSLVYHFSFLSPSLWETARYRLKNCLKRPLSPKQPTNQPFIYSAILVNYNNSCTIKLCNYLFLFAVSCLYVERPNPFEHIDVPINTSSVSRQDMQPDILLLQIKTAAPNK